MYQVGDLSDLNAADPVYAFYESALDDALKLSKQLINIDKMEDKYSCIGIWFFGENELPDLVAIVCDGKVYKK